MIPDGMYHLEKLGKTKFYPKTMFTYDEKTDTYTCPDGKVLVPSGSTTYKNDHLESYRSKEEDCKKCGQKEKCTDGKQRKISWNERYPLVEDMRAGLDSPLGAAIYKERMSTVEPVFGNIKENMGFRQFNLRGLKKTNTEYNLVCIAHNLLKIHEHIQKTGKRLIDTVKHQMTKQDQKQVLSIQLTKPQTHC